MGKVCISKGCDKEVSYDRENKCKNCISELRRERYRTDKSYYLNNRYAVIKQRAEGRCPWPTGSKGLPFCTKEEFAKWCDETSEIFDAMWLEWSQSGYETGMSPSVDRIKSERGYELGNLQWLRQSENSAKGNRDGLTAIRAAYMGEVERSMGDCTKT